MDLMVIGGGLAGSEAAWQAAERGIKVGLFEMRPERSTPAHVTGQLGELVCSNSLGSTLPDRAPGVLKAELTQLGSLLLACAETAAVPAGGALAVDRTLFCDLVTQAIASHPHITIQRQEVASVPPPPTPEDGPQATIVASGPLTSDRLAESLQEMTGQEALSFYDALAPIVSLDSIDTRIAFRASRYDRGTDEGDYINCPMSQEEYERFWEALATAERLPLRDFEESDARFFEACLPVEVIAGRGREALAFGPLRPVGLIDPRTNRQPYAIVQLRQDNLAGTLYNLVGFQTNLRYGEQERVFRLIPGLEKAEFVRFGQMHRNTFLNSPAILQPTLQSRRRADLFFAGQLTGVEGYVGSIATGLLAGLNATRLLEGRYPVILPPTTVLGALVHYVTHADPKSFQPMKANFGILPSPEQRLKKQERYRYYAERSARALSSFIRAAGIRPTSPHVPDLQ
jgi:methylenetetrahydrofolate--tRNA-(uracil-5-)-methyltransferase